MTTTEQWISITDQLPEVDDNSFSDDVYVKVQGKKAIGYYDEHQMQWWQVFKVKTSEKINPTHWMKIPHN